jgi:Xaa-Pro aminopeptidase
VIEKRSENIHISRLKNIRQSFKKKGTDGFLVTDLDNVRYLTGFSGSSGFLFVTEKENIFVTDFRYKEQSEKEVNGWDFIIERGDRLKIIRSLAKKNCVKNLGFESSVSYEFFKKLARTGINLIPSAGFIEKLREIKDRFEIDCIKKAVERAEAAFLDVKPCIRAGARETMVALKLEEILRKKGCRHIPFDIIVASGINSAMPHARPSEKRLNKGDLVTIDWGSEAEGYCADMTRTLLIRGGHGLSRKKEIYQIVLEANRRAISCVAPGTPSVEVDDAARNFIQKAGCGELFGHGTGHGVGLQVHEGPRITWNSSERIRENMVFTVEPGVYVPDLGGVRIEDMLLVRPGGPEVLTVLPKELEII